MSGAFDPVKHLRIVPQTPDSALFNLEFEEPPILRRRRRVFWMVIVLLTLLFHAGLLAMKAGFFSPATPERMQVEPIDTKKLEQIRQQWKRKDQQLLLDKNKGAKSDAVPKDARYFSDRNIRVEKEQRAKQTAILPTPSQSRAQKAHPKVEAKPHTAPLLRSLGIPMKLDSKPIPPQDAQEQQIQRDEAGDQRVQDKNLPEGSENLLNAQESVYYSFFSRLYEAIGPIWQSKLHEQVPLQKLEGDYTTQVDVVFDVDGNLIAINHLKDSGIPQFDSAVDRAWKMVGRFPNPPKGLLDAEGHVHTGWNFTVQVGPGHSLDWLPPERAN